VSAAQGESLYQLPVTLTTAAGVPMTLSSLHGTPFIITMFYGHCTSVCPVLTMQLQRITKRLSAQERRRIQVVMISFDSARDTPDVLAAFKSEHQITEDNWIVARASAPDVRLLAAVLGIQYRELKDHTFNHSAVLSVADRNGIVRAQTSDLSDANGAFVAAVRRQLASPLSAPPAARALDDRDASPTGVQ
jgi:protein SCO1